MTDPVWTFGTHGQLRQTLVWLTDVQQFTSGHEQRRRLRIAPRQKLGFSVLPDPDHRRYLETLLWRQGAAQWDFPLVMYPLQLQAELSAGAVSIPVFAPSPAFVAGGRALLVGLDPTVAEVVVIDSVGAALELVAPTALEWPAGTELYALRRGRFPAVPRVPRFTGDASLVEVEAELAEAVDYAESPGAITYRDLPVLELTPGWTADPAHQAARETEILDEGCGPVVVEDLPGLALPVQSSALGIQGREAIDGFLELLHWLAGRWRALWMPTYAQDLRVTAPIASGATTIDVAWCGLTANPGSINRRDIRIELSDGTVLYRRITATSELSTLVERLTIDSALGVAVAVADVALVSFLWLARLDQDVVVLDWWAHDTVTCSLNWKGFRHEF
jgi:hypothetical protein